MDVECIDIDSSDEEEQPSEPTPQRILRPQPKVILKANTPIPQNLTNVTEQVNQMQLKPRSSILNGSKFSERQIAKLKDNDSKFMAGFDPGNSRREKRKLGTKAKSSAPTQKTGLYNDKGLWRMDGGDYCDCLDLNCPGCHFSCINCSSGKCGHSCRVNRKWTYESIDHDAKDLTVKNKFK